MWSPWAKINGTLLFVDKQDCLEQVDRVLINAMWYATFDYTHSQYMPRGLSDHSPILLQFITTPKPVSSFQYCEMWSHHSDFPKIVENSLPNLTNISLVSLWSYLDQIRPLLRKLNNDKFADLKVQQLRARHELDKIRVELQQQPSDQSIASKERKAKEHYITILSSSLSLIKQQSKMDWINLGDDSTRLFFAKSK